MTAQDKPQTTDIRNVDTYENSIIAARNVETGYGDLQILFGVDLDVLADEIVVIFGPNGAGKSTCLQALYNLLPRWEGTVRIKDTDTSGTNPADMVEFGVNYVPQRNNVFPNLTVTENLEIGAATSNNPTDRMNEIYELFPALGERTSQQASTLSGGEQQMLALGRGLMTNPDLLFVDEPTAQLAPKLAESILDHIININEAGTAILMVEQNVRQALNIADRGYVLHQGENRFEGPASHLLESEQIRDLYMGAFEA